VRRDEWNADVSNRPINSITSHTGSDAGNHSRISGGNKNP
jgi:hypothetical protein